MLPEPAVGFADSLEEKVRRVTGKVTIQSHKLITSTKQDGSVNVTASNKYAQNFTIGASDLNVRYIDVFIARESDEEQDINVRILGDNSGQPDTGSVIGEAPLFNLGNKRPKFHRIPFFPSIVLTASTTYWLELSVTGDTSILWYKDSTATGYKYALNDTTITSDEALVMKVLSKETADNEFELPYILDYGLQISEKFDNDVATIKLSNLKKYYNEGQPLRNLLINDLEISFYLGNGTDFLKKGTLLIDDAFETESNLNVKCIGKGRKLIAQKVLNKTSYIGTDYSIIVDDILKQSRLLSTDVLLADDGYKADSGLKADTGNNSFDLTGKTMPTYGTVEGTLYEAIKKMEQVTGYIFYFDESGDAVFEEKNTTYTPVDTIEYDKHIFDKVIDIRESTKNLINRVRIDNEQTSDSNPISLNTAGAISSDSGTLLASEKTRQVTIVYPSPPVLNAELINKSGGSNAYELTRSATGITIELQNDRYPNSSSSYNYEVVGSTIGNDDANLKVQEKASFDSYSQYGINDYVKSNNLFSTVSNISLYISTLLYFNSLARVFFTLNTRGVPLIQNRDPILVDHPDIDSRFVYKVQSQSINYKNEKRQLSIAYEIDKYPFLNGEAPSSIVLTADEGNTADSGLNADSEDVLYKQSYV